MTTEERLEIAIGILADIAYADDMTLSMARLKADRNYKLLRAKELADEAADSPRSLTPEDRAVNVARDCAHLSPSAGPCGECVEAVIRAAVADERAACRKLAWEHRVHQSNVWVVRTADSIVAAIDARGTP